MSIKDDMEDVQEAVINELISDNGLNPLTVGDLQITTAKIADDAVTLAKLGSDVDLGQVNDGAVTEPKIANGAVTPAKLSQAYLPLTGGSVTGNVGIGTSSPSAKMHISGSSGSADGIHYIADNTRSAGGPAGIVMKSGHGNWKIMNSQTVANALEFIDGGAPDVTRMFIDSSGRAFIGTTTLIGAGAGSMLNIKTPTGSGAYVPLGLEVGITTNGFGAVLFKNPAGTQGSISINTSSVSYNTSSDYRLKTDAQPMTGASARVQALNPVNFEWISDGTRVDGFLAHEAQEVVPESVTGTKDALDEEGNPEYQGIDQSKLVPLLTAALQEALTKIEALEVRITNLEA